MLAFLFTALDWIPTAFDWLIVPVALILLVLSLIARTRPIAAAGFLTAAAVSAAFLSLILAASVFHIVGYGRAVADLLLNFGPAVTRDYVFALFRQNGPRLLAVVPMIVTALLSGVAAIYLRRRERLA
ncbi:MAG TPA: hypothetical protein VGG69_07410 [Rhizomicrobium sp.]|jgi:hypothetical protein